MTPAELGLAGAFLLVQCLLVVVVVATRTRAPTPQEPAKGPPADLEVRIAALELTVAGLPSLWESERSRAEAAANSARTARARAERLVKQRLELEDADADVREDDEETRRVERVPPVPANVGAPGVPDDYAAQMRYRALMNLAPM